MTSTPHVLLLGLHRLHYERPGFQISSSCPLNSAPSYLYSSSLCIAINSRGGSKHVRQNRKDDSPPERKVSHSPVSPDLPTEHLDIPSAQALLNARLCLPCLRSKADIISQNRRGQFLRSPPTITSHHVTIPQSHRLLIGMRCTLQRLTFTTARRSGRFGR